MRENFSVQRVSLQATGPTLHAWATSSIHTMCTKLDELVIASFRAVPHLAAVWEEVVMMARWCTLWTERSTYTKTRSSWSHMEYPISW